MTFPQIAANLNDSVLARFMTDLHPSLNSRLLVIITNAYLELFVQTLVDARCKNSETMINNGSYFGYAAKLIVLHELDVISDEEFAVLNWLRKLRNDAAHKALFDVKDTGLSNCPKRWLDAGTKPINFGGLCVCVLVDFVCSHNEVAQMATSSVSEFNPDGKRKKKSA